MGYLDNTSVTVDAIITTKGRELLSQGADKFKITQFALADDEIDYDLWNPAHPLGTDYYGIIIDNMPLIEALPDQDQMMKYKLLTLDKTTNFIPVITVSPSSIIATYQSQKFNLTPSTGYVGQGQPNSQLGYTAILSDNILGTLTATSVPPAAGYQPSVPKFIGDADSQSVATVGFEFKFSAALAATQDMTGTIVIIGNETGGSVSVPITIKQQTAGGLPA